MGSIRFSPETLHCEYIYSRSGEGALIFAVEVPSPERIVYLAVPTWVVQNIWQGEVSGTYAFESEARALLSAYEADLQPEANGKLFGVDPTSGGRI